jgi:hypothetical protein
LGLGSFSECNVPPILKVVFVRIFHHTANFYFD